MASLTETLAAQENPNFGTGIPDALKTGVQIAQAKQQVEGQKQELKVQKELLQQNQMNGVVNRLRAAAYAPKTQQSTLFKNTKMYADQIGVPVDIQGFEDLMKDETTALAFKKGLNQLQQGKMPPEEFFSIAASAPDLFKVVNAEAVAISQSQNKTASAADIAQIRASASQDRVLQAQERAASRQEKQFAKQDEREVKKEATDLSKSLGKDSLPEVFTAIKDIDEMTGGLYDPKAVQKLDKVAGAPGFTASFKIPLTQIAPLENAALKGEDLKLYQRVASLRNSYLKLRSGGAVTDPEAERFLAEMGQGGIRTGEQLQNGLQSLASAVNTTVQNIESGHSPEAVAEYRRRKGPVSSDFLPKKGAAPKVSAPAFDVNAFKAQQKAKGKTDAEIDAFLKTKGF